MTDKDLVHKYHMNRRYLCLPDNPRIVISSKKNHDDEKDVNHEEYMP